MAKTPEQELEAHLEVARGLARQYREASEAGLRERGLIDEDGELTPEGEERQQQFARTFIDSFETGGSDPEYLRTLAAAALAHPQDFNHEPSEE